MTEQLFPSEFWDSLTAIVPVVSVIAVAICGKFQIISKTWQTIVNAAVAIVVSVGGWFLNYATVGTPEWASLICLCVFSFLVGGGIYSVAEIKAIIDKIFPLRAAKKLNLLSK